jgi:predicted adenylyl cyclase CyaB
MKEIEVKILNVNRAKLVKTLKCLNAKKVFDGDIETLFFDFKDSTITKQGNVLRLRKEQEKIELTHKQVHITKTAKIAEEYSVVVSNLETTEKILENLGLSVVDRIQKHRVSYILNNARFDFDCYSGNYGFIHEFLEIEAESIVLVHKYAKLLGYEKKDCLPWTTTELINYYSKKKQ